MGRTIQNTIFTFITFFCLAPFCAKAQFIKGTVYDSTGRFVVEAVSVLSTSGRGTATDSLGNYKLEVSEKDSIWFSFLGKPTPKYAIAKIQNLNQFDISLRLKTDMLKEVRVRSRIYKEDSIQNRKDYAKVFDWRRPSLGTMTSISSSGVGFDIDEIIRLFQFRKNRSMEHFRERLLEQEHEKFVDHRFSKVLVRRLTGLDGTELENFMKQYRPSYQFALLTSEYDFQYYIKASGETFKSKKAF